MGRRLHNVAIIGVHLHQEHAVVAPLGRAALNQARAQAAVLHANGQPLATTNRHSSEASTVTGFLSSAIFRLSCSK